MTVWSVLGAFWGEKGGEGDVEGAARIVSPGPTALNAVHERNCFMQAGLVRPPQIPGGPEAFPPAGQWTAESSLLHFRNLQHIAQWQGPGPPASQLS